MTIGIDIGGSKIQAIAWNNKVLKKIEAPTPKNKTKLLNLLDKILKNLNYHKANGLGIGLPGIIDSKGKIIRLVHLPFMNGFNIANWAKKYNKRIKVANDVKCTAITEIKLSKRKDFVLISIGTGIGGAIVMNGKLYLGRGSAGEIGHMTIAENKSLEQLASGPTLKKHSKSEFDKLAHYLGIGLANIINILDPHMVVLSGGVVHGHSKIFLAKAKKEAAKHIISSASKTTKILPSKFSGNGAAVGAALLAS